MQQWKREEPDICEVLLGTEELLKGWWSLYLKFRENCKWSDDVYIKKGLRNKKNVKFQSHLYVSVRFSKV